MSRPSTITTDQNIEVVQGIEIGDRQISVRRLAYKLPVPTTIVDEIMSNHLGIKNVSTKMHTKIAHTYSAC